MGIMSIWKTAIHLSGSMSGSNDRRLSIEKAMSQDQKLIQFQQSIIYDSYP